jgi:hypothetical protein
MHYTRLLAECDALKSICDSYADENQRFFDQRDSYLAMCAELCEALKPLDRFSNMLDRQPIQGNGGILYALHMGTEDQALLREVDCRSASAALAKARKLLEGGE